MEEKIIGTRTEEPEEKGIGFFPLVGVVVSACLGSGAFAITGQLARVASPGAILIAWAIVVAGFALLSLSLCNLSVKRPELKGIFQYAEEGFGPLAGFVSGWGYWLSGWLGNIAFAVMIMSTLGYFFPMFLPGNNVPCIVIASLFTWGMSYLVIRGVESAAVLNAIVMVCKVAALAVFALFSLFLCKMGVLTADFWGNVYNNAVAAGQYGAGAAGIGGIGQQVMSCFLVMMWVYIGIEGAATMSSRAKRKSDVSKATLVGLVCLTVIYVCVSVLPYGFMSYTEIAALDYPATAYIFEAMAPGWGGAFISIAIIVSTAGCWLSFTMLPAETSQEMAEQGLLPESWGSLNKNGAPQVSLLLIGACIQVFLIVMFFSEDAYDFAFSMCTVAIVITWAFIAAYQARYSLEKREAVQFAIGAVALVFLVVGALVNGWSYLLFTCVGYIPGFIFYVKARRGLGNEITVREKVAMGCIIGLGVLALVLFAAGVIGI